MQYRNDEQLEKLLSLYQQKCTQVVKARNIANQFMYLVLRAEADAIKAELEHQLDQH